MNQQQRIRAISQTHSEAEVIHDRAAVDTALDRLAREISAELADSDPLILCTLIGGIIPTGLLLPRLDFPLQLDYVHATRYQGKTRGGDIRWIHRPSIPLSGRTVLLIDDILDEGLTLKALIDACYAEGASKVCSAVLISKRLPARAGLQQADYTALESDDRYLFGMGMDYHDYLRNCNAIMAVKEHD